RLSLRVLFSRGIRGDCLCRVAERQTAISSASGKRGVDVEERFGSGGGAPQLTAEGRPEGRPLPSSSTNNLFSFPPIQPPWQLGNGRPEGLCADYSQRRCSSCSWHRRPGRNRIFNGRAPSSVEKPSRSKASMEASGRSSPQAARSR